MSFLKIKQNFKLPQIYEFIYHRFWRLHLTQIVQDFAVEKCFKIKKADGKIICLRLCIRSKFLYKSLDWQCIMRNVLCEQKR